MDSAKWLKIKEALSTLLDLPESDQPQFLANIEDEEIRLAVDKMWLSYAEAEKFIDTPIIINGLTPPESKDDFIGKNIENYRILDCISTGGMGVVYLAERLNSDFKKKVALKIIKRGMDSELIQTRFAIERKILSTLEHPNIAQLLDGGISSDGLSFFVMEYVDGKPLNEFCLENQLNLKERLEIFRKICGAVDHAHKNLIIHRDLKPSNILITNDGIPKLLDFGIAKLLSNESYEDTVTASQSRVFTPEYASPEQLLGKAVTTATDVYSLGVILYELLSGYRPFEIKGKSFEEIVKDVCETLPNKPSEVITSLKKVNTQNQSAIRNLQLKGDLDNIILKSLQKEPFERYGSVQQFSEEIERFLLGLPVLARPQTLKYRFGKYVKRHKAGVLAAAIVLISLIGGISVATWQAIEARRERAKAEQRFKQVRQFANTVLFEYYEKIKEMAGATEVRAKMVKDSLKYLDNLAAESDYSPELQRELAMAYRKLAEIQGDPGAANLGDTTSALVSYQKGLTIQEKVVSTNLANLEDRRLVGNLMIDIAQQHEFTGNVDERLKYAQSAVENFTKLGTDFPAETKPRSDLARALWTLAETIRSKGDFETAISKYNQAVEIYESLAREKPEERKFSRNAALTYKNIGAVNEQKMDFQKALEFYRKSLMIDQKNAEEEPNNVTSQMDLSFSYGSICSVQNNLDNQKEALENCLKKLGIQQRVADSDNKNVFAKRALGITLNQLGSIWQKLSEPNKALNSFQQSIEIFQTLLINDPSNVTYKQHLGKTLTAFATFQASQKKPNSLLSFEKAIGLNRELFNQNKNNNNVIEGYIHALSEFGSFLLVSKKPEKAIEQFTEAINLFDSKSAQSQILEQKALILELMGNCYLQLKQQNEALKTYEASLDIWQQLVNTQQPSLKHQKKIDEILRVINNLKS